jgi:hypothetical protein
MTERPPGPSADVLSEVLAICRSQRAVSARFALTAPWGLLSEGTAGALIRLARGAPYWLQVQGQAALRIAPGDLVMIAPGARHRISSDPQAPCTPFAEMIARHADGPRDENPLVFSHGAPQGSGDFTDLYSTQVWFSAYCRHTVLRILPPCIHIREQDMSIAGCLATTMQLLIEETLARRPGWRLSAGRVGELLLVNILREHLARESAIGEGWLRGLTDPAIAQAIMHMHRAPQQGWTLASLASVAGMSRTPPQRTLQGTGRHLTHRLPDGTPHGAGGRGAGGWGLAVGADRGRGRLRIGQGVCPRLQALVGADAECVREAGISGASRGRGRWRVSHRPLSAAISRRPSDPAPETAPP